MAKKKKTIGKKRRVKNGGLGASPEAKRLWNRLQAPIPQRSLAQQLVETTSKLSIAIRQRDDAIQRLDDRANLGVMGERTLECLRNAETILERIHRAIAQTMAGAK